MPLGLTPAGAMAENFTVDREEDAVEASGTDEIRALDELRLEVEALRASRKRLVMAADADRRGFERALHDGLQQQLVGLAADVEIAARSAGADPESAKEQLGEVRRGVQQALEELRTLANRIYPALDAGGLAPALRLAATEAGVRARIDAEVGASVPPEVASAIYFCCRDVLFLADGAATITIRERDDGLAFEILADGEIDAAASRVRDRVEALGGTLDARSGSPIEMAGFVPGS